MGPKQGRNLCRKSWHSQNCRIEAKIDNLTCTPDIEQASINEVVCEIEQLFQSTSQKTFGIGKYIGNKGKVKHKLPWFNMECQNTRNKYHKIKKAYNKYKTDTLKHS